jgi:hypothetical protein
MEDASVFIVTKMGLALVNHEIPMFNWYGMLGVNENSM